MKIRISEAQLKQIIRESMYELEEPALDEPGAEKSKGKVVNKTKNIGTFRQTYQGDPYAYQYNIPGFAVEVKGVTDQDIFNHLYDMVMLSPVGDYYLNIIQETPELLRYFKNWWEETEPGKFSTKNGFKVYRNLLNGAYNQVYKSGMYADEIVDTIKLTPENDPIKTTYGPRSEKSPFILQNGVVRAKDENFVSQYFEKFEGNQIMCWDLATYHENDNTFIFFFWDLGARNTFVKHLKNMFMIASHIFKNGYFSYTFIQSFNPQLQIVQLGGGTDDNTSSWGGEDPRTILTPEEDEGLLALLNKLEEIQRKDEDERIYKASPEYAEQKAKEEKDRKERLADLTISTFAPVGISDNSALSSYKIGGVGTKDGLAEAKLRRMIKESIIKLFKNK